MKNNRGLIITLIVLLSILAIGLSIFLGAFLTGNHSFHTTFFKYKTSNELLVDEYYDEAYTKLKIASDSSDVTVHESTDNRTHVIIYGDKDLLEFTNDDGYLKIILEEEKCFGFCFNLTKDSIEVYLPKEQLENIDIDVNYGNVTIGNFENADMNIKEDCGNVEIASGKNIDVKNNYGNIEIDHAKEVNLKDDCGDIKVGEVDDAIIDNNLGKIKVTKINNYLDIVDDCGDIILDSVNLNKDSKVVNNLGSIIINDTNDIYIDAKTDLGDTKINNNNRHSDITLKIKNDCGDIKVNN